ncbi:MAG: 1,4-alpha-glucan branching protein GlgB [Lewinellaceae bacterium]|nr:1,4-alpha-glucan branching protein GlgB [Saprospiraceae bacterium]MCB9340893.1 1,4-alpha-glucan branching protein GlgB [Lewinellaceae bacterium]
MDNVRPHSLLTDYDIDLLKLGKHYRLYKKMGSHPLQLDGEWGTLFSVWAPSAREVSVIGNFNFWNEKTHKLFLRPDGSGIWEGWIKGVGKGTLYKYSILAQDKRRLAKGDPYARFWEVPPNTASIVWDPYHEWKDEKWLKERSEKAGKPQPYSVYEVHLGSWKKKADGIHSFSYKELVDEMVPYVKEMGFTHVEFLPVMEHPYFPSWGYQITGYFAPTSRFGFPEDFMFLVDAFHREGIGVILDWVPSHFPYDAHGLADFDGTHLYDHADPRKGFHPDWKSAVFNHGRWEVRSFLISNAMYWLDEYHIDGLRVDAVASILYLDYSREEGQWVPNQYGGKENIEAIEFLKEFNSMSHRDHPEVVTIAEESTAWPGVSKPVEEGGLGFDQKWMMGWMHDTLKYIQYDPIFRKNHHHELTFSMVYAFSEKFMLPLSHDEVVHGKGPLIDKMPGNEQQKFAGMRLLFGYMWTHPGTQLLFMGGEFAQTSEWNIERGLEWWLTRYETHQGVQAWVKDLNHFYRDSKALYEKQFDHDGFEWIDHADWENSVLTYIRKGKNEKDVVLVVCNFTPVVRENYRFGVPFKGQWKEVLNSDDKKYGGAGFGNPKPVKADKKESHNRDYSIEITLPGLATLVFEPNNEPSSPQKKKAVSKKAKAS